MRFRKSIFLFLILAMAVCNNGSADKAGPVKQNADSTIVVPAAVVCDTAGIAGSVHTIRNQDLLSTALQTALSCKSLDSAFQGTKMDRKTRPNVHDRKLFDTTVIYHADCDSATYLIGGSNCFPLRLNIQSQRIALDSGLIKVGMSEDKFLERYHLAKGDGHTIKITDTEGSNELIFFFSGGLLKKIVYDNLYVD
jgi:hypothetical protein